MRRYCTSIFCFFLFSLSSYSYAQEVKKPQDTSRTQYWLEPQDYRANPEAETDPTKKKRIISKDYMIVTANPYATSAGNYILDKGGSAVDAAIAAQLVLTLVEPQSSGIGGGGFMLHWDQKRKRLTSYDGRETAPASVKPDHFIDEDGKPLGFHQILQQGLAIGVPGAIRLLEQAHFRYGKLPWSELFQPAMELAFNGFRVSPRLHKLLNWVDKSKFDPVARDYFYKDGRAVAIGQRLTNPALGKTFQLLAEQGAQAFYRGDIAKLIIHKVREMSNGQNGMTLDDLAGYRAIRRDPICVTYRGYRICGMGPPSSGGITIAQTLKLIEPYNIGSKPLGAQALHLITEAQKLSYADRKRYLADSDFVKVPLNGLLDGEYLDKRRKLINKTKSMGKAQPGKPPFEKQTFFGQDGTEERPGTSHLSIIDKDGNAVSYTASLETAFGSKIMVNGFLLNSQLTDFSRLPRDKAGNMIANRIEPGKRPRSSMAPTIVFDENNELKIVLGSPGGSRIILYVLKSLIAMIDWKLDAQGATSLPNFGSRNGPLEIEKNALTTDVMFDLKTYGHKIKVIPMISGLHLIEKKDGKLYSGVDPSREGVAMGR